MYRQIVQLKKNMIVIECYKAKEICMYNKLTWVCYHWDTEEDSISIIKKYCNDNNIDISNLEFRDKEDYLMLINKNLFN